MLGVPKRAWLVLLLILAVPVAYVGWLLFDRSVNLGRHSGYFGQYNRTRSGLASIPGVSITRGGYNPDISLEEFEFDILFDGKPVYLYFSEDDPIRWMARDSAVVALKARILGESARTATPVR